MQETGEPASAPQLEDDLALLDAMVDDMNRSDELYRPTNYWAPYCEAVADYLRREGLRHIRRSEDELLSTFGVADVPPRLSFPDGPSDNPQLAEIIENVVGSMNRFWEEGFRIGPGGLSLPEYFTMAERVADHAAAASSLPAFSSLSLSRNGNPFGSETDTGFRTFSSMFYFHMICFAARSGALRDVDTIVEIGSGHGGAAEVMKTLFPNVTIVLIDLAPQLYVAQRFLSSVFPNATLPYHETRPDVWDGVPKPGGIHFLCPRAIERLAPEGRVLFWNTASFGEMEPEVVANYAKHISRFADCLFLMQLFTGKQRGNPGEGGVLRPSLMEDYEQAFAGYRCVATEPALEANGVTVLREGTDAYQATVWTRSEIAEAGS